MIVYVESNFLLELAYLQEQHESCEELLEWAEARRIVLAVPTFCVPEVRESFPRRANRRRKFHDRLKREVRELSRSKPYQQIAIQAGALTAAFIESTEAERQRLDLALSRILKSAELLPIGSATVRQAIEQERRFDLSAKDAVVLAAILEDLQTRPQGPKYFLNRNSKDFIDPSIEDELRKYECTLVPSFRGGTEQIRRLIFPSALPKQHRKPPKRRK
jgi:predicted nucleic acid-binding protein